MSKPALPSAISHATAPIDDEQYVTELVNAMSQGHVGPLFEAMAEDVTWRWTGVGLWSRAFEGEQIVIDELFGGAAETLGSSSRVEVHGIHTEGNCVVVGHPGRNEPPDGHRYDNDCCWIVRFRDGLIRDVREYVDTQLVSETFGPDGS